MREQAIPVEDIIQDATLVLEQQGYKLGGRKFQTIYRGLSQFSQSKHNGNYSIEIGEAYVQSLRDREIPVSADYIRSNIREMQRLNHIMEGDTDWRPSKPSQEYAVSVFQNEAKHYNEYLRNSGKSKSDIRGRMHVVARFLLYLDDSGINNLLNLTVQCIYEAFSEATDKGGFRKCVGAFLRYAYRHSLIEEDLSVVVPTTSRHIPVPTVYTPDEVEAIITAATCGKCGKRNKAIVLIAARLGLRSCDIANLRFENICRDSKTIELTQEKTGQPLSLPLLPEIMESLDDYTENERPTRGDDHIFLCDSLPHIGAIQPHTIYTIVSRIIELSEVDPRGRKRGAHALRSSLATALINEGYTHREVGDALGQKSPEAVKAYVKTDVEHLRDYALPVPVPSGLFAEKLGIGGRV